MLRIHFIIGRGGGAISICYLLLLLLILAITSISRSNQLSNNKKTSSRDDSDILIYIMYHDHKSKRYAQHYHKRFPAFTIPVYIRSTKFFESIVYRDVLPFRYNEWRHKSYVGILSYRAAYSVTCYNKIIEVFANASIISTHSNSKIKANSVLPFDVIPLFLYDTHFNDFARLLVQAGNAHGDHFMKIWNRLLGKMWIGADAMSRHKDMRGFYRNSFLCKPQIMMQLMELMNQAIDLTILDDEIANMMAINAGYGRAGSNLTQQIFSKPYYEFHPFIFERLPVLFVNHLGSSIYFHETEYGKMPVSAFTGYDIGNLAGLDLPSPDTLKHA